MIVKKMNNITKLRFVLLIASLLAVLTFISAIAVQRIFFAIVFIVVSVTWTAVALFFLWSYINQRKAGMNFMKINRNKKSMRFYKICFTIMFVACLIRLVTVFIYGSQLSSFLATLWWMITSANELFFVPIFSTPRSSSN